MKNSLGERWLAKIIGFVQQVKIAPSIHQLHHTMCVSPPCCVHQGRNAKIILVVDVGASLQQLHNTPMLSSVSSPCQSRTIMLINMVHGTASLQKDTNAPNMSVGRSLHQSAATVAVDVVNITQIYKRSGTFCVSISYSTLKRCAAAMVGEFGVAPAFQKGFDTFKVPKFRSQSQRHAIVKIQLIYRTAPLDQLYDALFVPFDGSEHESRTSVHIWDVWKNTLFHQLRNYLWFSIPSCTH